MNKIKRKRIKSKNVERVGREQQRQTIVQVAIITLKF